MKKIRLQLGMTLLELMVAMTIGIFLVGGAFVVFLSASDSRRTNEDISRMQENARYAMDTIKPDVRLAGYWGLTRELSALDGFKNSVTQLDEIADDCEPRWYIDLANPVFASNDTNPYSATCIPTADYQTNSDVLVLRHASPNQSSALQAGLMYIRTDAARGEVFEGSTGVATGPFSPDAQDHRLLTHAYYVRPYTFASGDGLPSLRRLVLDSNGTDPQVRDEEVISGIEDLQVQYGIDDNGDGSVNRYVDPDTALGASEVLALRIWVMARAPTPEVGHADSNTYEYGSRSYTPNDNFRRMLLTSTIQLRNLKPVVTP